MWYQKNSRVKQARTRQAITRVIASMLLFCGYALPTIVYADDAQLHSVLIAQLESTHQTAIPATPAAAAISQPDKQPLADANPVEIIKSGYALGLTKYRLDHRTKMLGWQISDKWYFGRQKGEDSGLTFVWQASVVNQVSISKDGFRYTHHF